MLPQVLINRLEKVEPALAINQLIPLLTHYWFTGTHLMAYNDQIGLQVPMKTEFRGAVPGKFLELLKVKSTSTSKNKPDKIELSGSTSELVVKQGRRTNFRLAMLEPNFVFKMPEQARQQPLSMKSIDALVDAFSHCLISVGRDTSTIEQLGITLEPKGNNVDLYATDGATISRSKLAPGTIRLEARAIVPTKFCEQMIALYRAKRTQCDFEVGIAGQTRYALFKAGQTSLYGRLLESRNPLNFEGTVAYHLPRDHSSKLVKVPGALHAALERACIVCDAQRRLTHMILDNGRMVLKSKSDTEEVTDELLYPHNGASRLEVKLEPKLLKKAEDYDKMMVHGPCVIMAKGQSVYLVSCSTA
jgi:DNA polymerase III sliding clamp (beta) subunit (PCNA family)